VSPIIDQFWQCGMTAASRLELQRV
jgi:hypothetical protein